jgi:putative redox protein
MIHVEVVRVSNDYGFEGKDASGHTVRMDSSPESGGLDFGIRPMQMLLMGLGSCSGIDIVSILKKQKQTVNGFRISIDGEREAGKEPEKNYVIFELKGPLNRKAKRAVLHRKILFRCGTLLGAGCTIDWELKIS